MKKLPLLVSIVILTSLGLYSCEEDSCPPNALAYAHFSLVNQNGNPISITVPTSIIGQIKTDIIVHDTLADGSIIEKVVTDSVISDTLINKESNMSSFKVPLGYSDETSFIIDYDGIQKDYITLKHKNIPYFTNLDCGTMMFYEATSVTHSNGIDSIIITNPNIDNYEKENFKIYFTVSESQ